MDFQDPGDFEQQNISKVLKATMNEISDAEVGWCWFQLMDIFSRMGFSITTLMLWCFFCYLGSYDFFQKGVSLQNVANGIFVLVKKC